MSRYIGVDVPEPEKVCNDVNCPFHGSLRVRGRILTGTVVSHKMQKSVVVRRDYLSFVKKYKRYERKHSTIASHNPPCIDAREGDIVKIMECRPLSKTIAYVVIAKEKQPTEGKEQ
ncbi:MAG: 30S ribosomal protein S17 [Candidatus Heimdallarchaeota archaeon]|nr:30S ribosomal protein S17 [Candidatus Heimdallarchaeota archaeon]RLI63124.1 MAG: 30S ribosomal protein S17 [Candidatus Gerdarchaeota archaeon]RLI71380.1 MAG: 30S ribosomal protein S17 [Candidatus Gerdarchaeota archaeon]RLI73435.1 MAG: 30S ribosomal protein S17 [Candidatus Heimdallarchaeota archaeon]